METTSSNINLKISFPTDGAKLMRYDFVNLIEGAQACPTPYFKAWVSEEPDPVGMVTGVVPAQRLWRLS